jgi:cellobiose-specific phosphotransferase system component IIC
MKTTKYLDNEIELLNAIKRNNELSDYRKEKLSEFNTIKQALTIPVVSTRFSTRSFIIGCGCGMTLGLMLAIIIINVC